MTSTYGVALSGMQDASLRVTVSAHNRANTLTAGFVPRQVVSSESANGGVTSRMVPQSNPSFDAAVDETTLGLSGTNLVDETVGSMMAVTSFKASLAAITTASELDETLMRIKA
jgi:flagellar basal body rod protein FlgC